MNYRDINAATAHHIHGDLQLASRYYNKIFRRLNGPPRWLYTQLYQAFREVKTANGSFMRYNPNWNQTIEETISSYDIERPRRRTCLHPIYTAADLVCTCCCCHYRCPTHSPEYYC